MKIRSKENKKIGIHQNLLPKNLIMNLSKFALLVIFLQIISIPFILKYNKPSIKYILGISSKKDLYIKSEFYKSKFSDFSGYLKDIYASIFSNKIREALFKYKFKECFNY